jgi:hypothetical protein
MVCIVRCLVKREERIAVGAAVEIDTKPRIVPIAAQRCRARIADAFSDANGDYYFCEALIGAASLAIAGCTLPRVRTQQPHHIISFIYA